MRNALLLYRHFISSDSCTIYTVVVSFKSLDLIFSRNASHDVQLAVTKKEVLSFIG